MSRFKGTPKSLKQAIKNGIHYAKEERAGHERTVELIRLHVKDFIAQKISVLMFDAYKGKVTQNKIARIFKRMTK